jgi:ring-1,2-phenylacetyl-CoA epoxidase subunit PaaD
LEEVSDPEIPVLTIIDLGVVRSVSVDGEKVKIIITPTYSGCPAMQVIEEDIKSLLKSKGIQEVEVKLVLSPAWTTDWISENGRIKLKEYGIAPPADEVDKSVLFADPPVVEWFPNSGVRLVRLNISVMIVRNRLIILSV